MSDHAAGWDFECTSHESGATTRVAPSGELDLLTAPQLDDALRAAQQRAASVTLDLRRLSFMDCSSLGLVTAAADRARESDSRFRIVRGVPIIDRLFAITGIDRRIGLT